MIKNLENKLISKGINPTAMRLLVLEKLSQQSTAISHKELIALFDRADATTLFRTLKTLLKHNIVHSIDDGSGLIKYALCMDGCTCCLKDLHTHFHCTVCKNTYCLYDTAIPTVSIPQNFTLKEVTFVLKGVCDGCK